MELVELSHNDDITSITKKCNINFKNMWFTLKKFSGKQSRYEQGETNVAIDDAIDGLVTTTIPNVVASQIAEQDIPSQINSVVASQIAEQDIPKQIEDAIEQEDISQKIIDEIDRRMSDMYPEIGSYVISDNTPSYDDTTWQQVGTFTIDSGHTVPVWKRVS